MQQNIEWKYVSFCDAVNIFDMLRDPINSSDRSKRIIGKKHADLFPYYGATGQVGFIDSYLVDGEYVLLGEDGAPFLNPSASKAYIISGKAWVNNHAHILRSKGNNRFLLHYLNFFDYKGFVSGTTRLKLTQAQMKRIPVPVPPLAEQERIVARIEELFSQLNAGVETLKKAKAQLAVYRQSVLKEAFADFTEKKPIGEMSSIVTSGSRGWAQYYADKGARFIRITDLTRDGIQLKNDSIQYVTLPDKAEGKRSRLLCGDVLVSITADLGSIALIPGNIEEAYINQHIAMVRFNNPAQGEFMAWYLRSEWGQKDLLKNKRGGGKLGLSLDDIRDTPVPVVSDEEAMKTVAFIDARLSICASIEQTINTALQQSEAMRQSILKQAFNGGLKNV